MKAAIICVDDEWTILTTLGQQLKHDASELVIKDTAQTITADTNFSSGLDINGITEFRIDVASIFGV
ncbi:MAG: hypothetical protein F6K24_38220, partial [Okeania sp. SIO2D1]|nr:hypothetical protein [Okeania sp. SIO2D1]